ncbi:MAG: glycoside hydrolase [Verrucomicrobia bacterium]|nr:glycoside hydrolase [Verrucomicrobiota bacterium]
MLLIAQATGYCNRLFVTPWKSRMKDMKQSVLWRSQNNGYHTYRIPALAVTGGGWLLAFCEGRKRGEADNGRIDVLVKRSANNGATWSEQQVVWNDHENTCGNPSPVIDRQTGVIWLLLTWNRGDDHELQIINQTSRDTRRVFVTCSSDDGCTWAKPREITADVKQPNWTWYATGPGAGIQVQTAPYTGRLLVPCDHIEAGSKRYYSHVIYSDDHGKSWCLGGRTPRDGVNECEVVELVDGRLLLNMRNYYDLNKMRQVAFSRDGGLTWEEQRFDEALVEPICQASIRRFAWPAPGCRSVILFSNPASQESRVKMTVRTSFDEGKTWPLQKTLYQGPSAYSDLAVLGNGDIFCLFESGKQGPYERITLARFSLNWLEAATT